MARLAVGMLALLAFGCLAHQAAAVNGGSGCQYIDRRELALKLTNNGVPPTPAVYFAFLNQLARTNNWVCKTCGTGTQKVNTAAPVDIGLIAPGFGQCTCASGFGAFSYRIDQTSTTTPLVVANPGKLIQGIGCTKCPTGQKGPNTYDGTTTAAALLIGPYAPASNTWTGTRCTCTVTATGAAC
ncbi:hypothetical protein MNEG_3318 [Monoraphidium neglectum]|uniref:Uncharacterized protein n=1 Tax=Monoraphidium neglectum TaxID=145388 RepID=A0A0D2MVX9_9CHLO|nr:hypothetical protein MNEG_3318 [Monoraphidium neglectum]KIZ04637.1 hypothetical protein MNEG_3318 [Monoraphidium neglectum]|eukprot:XP_013903656.1 hypothetical protein MNEG_3318 [Monoraphidium neglectum]